MTNLFNSNNNTGGNTGSAGSLFGGGQQKPQGTATNLFANNTNPSGGTGGNLFSNNQQQSSSLFGGGNQQQPQQGTNQPTDANKPAQTQGSLFGGTGGTDNKGQNIFGQSATQPSSNTSTNLFANSGGNANNIFPKQEPKQNAKNIGAQKDNAGGANNLFGANNQQKAGNMSSNFSFANNQNPSTGGLFPKAQQNKEANKPNPLTPQTGQQPTTNLLNDDKKTGGNLFGGATDNKNASTNQGGTNTGLFSNTNTGGATGTGTGGNTGTTPGTATGASGNNLFGNQGTGNQGTGNQGTATQGSNSGGSLFNANKPNTGTTNPTNANNPFNQQGQQGQQAGQGGQGSQQGQQGQAGQTGQSGQGGQPIVSGTHEKSAQEIQWQRCNKTMGQLINDWKSQLQDCYTELRSIANKAISEKQRQQNLKILNNFNDIQPQLINQRVIMSSTLSQMKRRQDDIDKKIDAINNSINAGQGSYINHPLTVSIEDYNKLKESVLAQQDSSQDNSWSDPSAAQMKTIFESLADMQRQVQMMNNAIDAYLH